MHGDIGSYYTETSPTKLAHAHQWLRREAGKLRGSRCGRLCIARRGAKGVRWGRAYSPDHIEMELDVLFELLAWDYSNCCFRWGSEVILHQKWGIAMGAPPAPSNAIVTAAFMEMEWEWSIKQDAKLLAVSWDLSDRFISSRFMDDTATAVAYCDQ